MILDTKAIPTGPDIFYDSSFRSVLEDHLMYLKKHPETTLLSVDSHIAYKFEFDLFSLFNYYNIQPHYHWLVMRMNNFTSPTDGRIDLETLLIPNITVVEHMRQSHASTRRLT
jgi:hypothetical protein